MAVTGPSPNHATALFREPLEQRGIMVRQDTTEPGESARLIPRQHPPVAPLDAGNDVGRTNLRRCREQLLRRPRQFLLFFARRRATSPGRFEPGLDTARMDTDRADSRPLQF